jgi:predicted O-methyltransferase YrrM
MTVADFEQLYRSDPDPWGYRFNPYERAKYAATLAACGGGPFESALELGGSIGVFSAQLAPRCRSLMTIDFSRTAVRRAKRALAGHAHVEVIQGRVPDDLPAGPFDLVLASEVLYYLDAAALGATLVSLEQRLPAGGRLVCVHWRTPGPERPLPAEQVHRTIRELEWLTPVWGHAAPDYLLDVLERR